jgi:plastocyanin
MQVRSVGLRIIGKALALATAMAMLAVACGGDDGGSAESTDPPLVALSGALSNHGTKDLGSATKIEVELADLYFAPTFIKAKPGSAVEVSLKNEGEARHSFTIDATNTNVELDAGQKNTTTVTLPASGALVFYCSFHLAAGMQGAFSVSAVTTAAEVTTTVASSSYGY